MLGPVSKHFGLAVRARRVAAGLSQEALAEQAGLHPTYVSMVERGLRNPTLDVSARLAEALEVDLSALIGEAQRNRSRVKTAVARRKPGVREKPDGPGHTS